MMPTLPTRQPVSGHEFLHRHGLVAALILTCWLVAISVRDYRIQKDDAPDMGQRIAAILVFWGGPADRAAGLVSREEFRKRLESLESRDGDERVRAVRWLSERGLREAGPGIAVSLRSPGTQRPCQMAHGLGRLGDDRWVPVLVESGLRTTDRDLRVCALIALGELGSSRALDGVMEAYEQNLDADAALRTLAEIAAPSSESFFRDISKRPKSDEERRLAETALKRITALQSEDPAAALIEIIGDGRPLRHLDGWAVRRLAQTRDTRAIPVLCRLFVRDDLPEIDRISVAAALVSFGRPGVSALRQAKVPVAAEPVRAAMEELTQR